jgi:hypothetical protein
MAAAPHAHEGISEVDWIAQRAGYVAKAVKGLLIALAIALSLELTSDAGAAALALVGSVLGLLAANLYADFVQREIEAGHRLSLTEIRALMGHSLAIPAGAAPAFLLFVAAWLQIVSTDLAINAAIWSGIGLLFVLGYASGRMQSDTRLQAVGHGLILGLVGVGVLIVKTVH